MELVYFHEIEYTSVQYPYIAKVKNKGDQWCKLHCLDLHASELTLDMESNSRKLKFRFRSDSDMLAFQIGFSPNDCV